MNSKSGKPLLEKGMVLNEKWEILEHLATGGKGEIYKARQLNLDREVAIKIISKEFFALFDDDEEEIQVEMDRFRREVLAMAQIRHPHVLQVYDHDQAVIQRNGNDMPVDYIVMEYIPGSTLRSTMPAEGLRESERDIREWIRRYFLPILEGVETIHALGIVHRDLKPENVLMDNFTPKITDFGLAGGPKWQKLTRSHHMVGTIAYMAPEQFLEMGETDFRGDIYALGKILYEAISGKMGKDNSFPFKTAHLANPDSLFLRRVDRIIQQATDEDIKQRLPSVMLLKQAILDLLEEREEPFTSKPSRSISEGWIGGLYPSKKKLIIAITGFVILTGVGVGILSQREKIPAFTNQLLSRLPQGSREQASNAINSDDAPKLVLRGKDGATLHLVPGGDAFIPKSYGTQAGETVKIDSFYMDETEVTNHQYVEFLNQVLRRIRVENGVVYGDGKIWLLLGEVEEGYEPIILQDGKFFIKNPEFATNPVVRVTGYGAEAYALFQGRRLPTETEWLYALMAGKRKSGEPSIPPRESDIAIMHTQMHSSSAGVKDSSRGPDPVMLLQPNGFGIRGLDRNVKEWGLLILQPSPGKNEEQKFVVMGGAEDGSNPELTPISAIARQPWEAFTMVGFRCALSILP